MAKKSSGKGKKSSEKNLPKADKDRQLRIGSFVKMNDSRTLFEIIDGPNSRDEYLIASGALRVWMAREDLTPQEPPPRGGNSGKQPKIEYSESGTQVDLHGMTVADARTALERALDNALLRNLDYLDVIHGIGAGKLSKAVEDYLKRSKHVKRFQVLNENRGTTRAYL